MRFSSWKLFFLFLACMCARSRCVNLSSGSNKLLFVLQTAYVIPSRNEQSAEREASQLVWQPPLTDMRQLLGFSTPLLPAQPDPALQTCSQVSSHCFTCMCIVTPASGEIPCLWPQLLSPSRDPGSVPRNNPRLPKPSQVRSSCMQQNGATLLTHM